MSEFINLSAEICKIIDKEGHKYNGESTPESNPQALIPGLPVERFSSPASLTVIVRQMRTLPEDMDRYFDFFRSATEEGDGFCSEEFPTKELFWKLNQSVYNVVLEDKHSGKWVAILYMGSSLYSRSRGSNDVFDAGMIIAKEFRNSGFGTEIVEIIEMIARKLGCRVLLSDTPIHHIASIAIIPKSGYAISGTLPRAFYARTCGWTDVVIFNKTLDTVSKL